MIEKVYPRLEQVYLLLTKLIDDSSLNETLGKDHIYSASSVTEIIRAFYQKDYSLKLSNSLVVKFDKFYNHWSEVFETFESFNHLDESSFNRFIKEFEMILTFYYEEVLGEVSISDFISNNPDDIDY